MFNLNNTKQAQMFGNSDNIWNDNYWSDYKGVDNDKEGIGNTPYQIRVDVDDKHPYMQKDE